MYNCKRSHITEANNACEPMHYELQISDCEVLLTPPREWAGGWRLFLGTVRSWGRTSAATSVRRAFNVLGLVGALGRAEVGSMTCRTNPVQQSKLKP